MSQAKPEYDKGAIDKLCRQRDDLLAKLNSAHAEKNESVKTGDVMRVAALKKVISSTERKAFDLCVVITEALSRAKGAFEADYTQSRFEIEGRALLPLREEITERERELVELRKRLSEVTAETTPEIFSVEQSWRDNGEWFQWESARTAEMVRLLEQAR
jgi:hypothetical protein